MNLDWIDDSLAELTTQSLRRQIRTRTSAPGGYIAFDGHAPLLDFGSNDYLGLAADQRVCQAAREAIDDVGWGSASSPLIHGHTRWHAMLELALARFERAEAAVLFPTGYAANVGVITALAQRGDAVFSDAKNHASIIDGCRLSRAELHIYRHRDPNHLSDLLSASTARRRLVVTDGLFSMDGDIAPLPEIQELCRRHDAMLLVDEAHATGVLGAGGRGSCEWHGLDDAPVIRVGTLSKALGSLGGFVVGTQSLIEWITNRARTLIFATAAPAACCAATMKALRIVEEEPHRRERLMGMAAQLRDQLRELGWSTGHSASQIIPVIVGSASQALELARRLQTRGLFVPCIRPPSVPPGESVLRISLSYSHRDDMVQALLDALGAAA